MGKPKKNKKVTTDLLKIKSGEALTAEEVDRLSKKPGQLKKYLNSSENSSLADLLFGLTYERFSEKEAGKIWENILDHKVTLNKQLKRDIGILVAALDYLSNITDLISQPKIIQDHKVETAAKMATTDDLTGLYLRDVFEFSLQKEISKFFRYDNPLSLIMMDIDDFKIINDEYGHQKGDEILKQIGEIILKNSRESDIPVRYGGEEFSVILPETPIGESIVLAERLRNEIEKHFNGKKMPVTISLGIGYMRKNISSFQALVKDADDALYTAKKSGKNKVVKGSLK
ncbi:MAG: GGDEF domain-containing protein [Desulfobacterales bacterium]|nr:GGDEF domain-containing protein [Desulfobacterales bacterium]